MGFLSYQDNCNNPMLKIDYILLVKHFRAQTSDEEESKIISWRNENIINNLTFNRLYNVFTIEQTPLENQKITKEETIAWKKIINKILKEEKLYKY